MKQLYRIAAATLVFASITVFGLLAFAPSADALSCAILPQDICGAAEAQPNGTDVKPTGLFLLLRWILTILTAVVGIAAIGTLVYAGIMYSSAGSDSGMVSKAKTLIRDVIIGVIAYGLMVVGLNWLVPGGIIG